MSIYFSKHNIFKFYIPRFFTVCRILIPRVLVSIYKYTFGKGPIDKVFDHGEFYQKIVPEFRERQKR